MFNIFSFIFGLSPCTRIWIPQGWELLPALCTDVSPVANNIRFVKKSPNKSASCHEYLIEVLLMAGNLWSSRSGTSLSPGLSLPAFSHSGPGPS